MDTQTLRLFPRHIRAKLHLDGGTATADLASASAAAKMSHAGCYALAGGSQPKIRKQAVIAPAKVVFRQLGSRLCGSERGQPKRE
jgi:hypothetical protein